MQKNQSYDYLIKLLVIGNSGVGKTNMLLRFCENSFMPSHLSTIGIDFKIKTITVGKEKVRLQIWDTAGQERFKTITQTYYRGAMGIIMTYAINERDSFQDIRNWMKQIKTHATENVFKVLVGNKCDVTQRQVTETEGRQLAAELGMRFYETSAKEDIRIEDVFMELATEIKQKLENEQKAGAFSYSVAGKLSKESKLQKAGNCC